MKTQEQIQEMYNKINLMAIMAARSSGNRFEVLSGMSLVLMWVLGIVDELNIEN